MKKCKAKIFPLLFFLVKFEEKQQPALVPVWTQPVGYFTLLSDLWPPTHLLDLMTWTTTFGHVQPVCPQERDLSCGSVQVLPSEMEGPRQETSWDQGHSGTRGSVEVVMSYCLMLLACVWSPLRQYLFVELGHTKKIYFYPIIIIV